MSGQRHEQYIYIITDVPNILVDFEVSSNTLSNHSLAELCPAYMDSILLHYLITEKGRICSTLCYALSS